MAKERVKQQSYKEVSDLVDAGLRKYMLNVFSYMSLGLGLTALVAYLASTSVAFMSFVASGGGWMLMLAQIGIVMYLSFRISSIPSDNAKLLFLIYSGLLGLSLSLLFFVYSPLSIIYTFFVTSSMFLGMVIYGYATNKDLTSFGSFLLMGLIGLIVAGLANIFIHSATFSFVIAGVGVIVFTGFTAYDTQVIKSIYLESDSSEESEKKAIIGALRLYLDFINLFVYLLRFLGTRRD
jgi:FtsH-binding integral membrane protein